jgi:hypothetical protein
MPENQEMTVKKEFKSPDSSELVELQGSVNKKPNNTE